jgi:hypothetical protein
MFFYLNRMRFDDNWNEFMKEWNTRKRLVNTTDTVLRFLLRKIVKIILHQKQLFFCEFTLINFPYGTITNSDNRMHKILWNPEFRQKRTFYVVI